MDEINNNNQFGQVHNQGQQPMYNQNENQFQNPNYVQVTEGYNPNYNNYNSNGSSSKKPLAILGIIVVLLVALAGVAFAAYKFIPGMILSGKDAYFAMEAKSIENVMKMTEKYIGEDYQAMLEKPMKSDMKITAKFDGNIPQQSKAMIGTLLKDTSIELKTQSDYKNEYESLELDLKILGEDLNVDFQNDNGMLAIGVKQLYDKYITVDGNDLSPLWKNLGAKNGPKKIISNKDLIETIELTKDEEKYLNKASKEYLKLIKKNINGKNFTTKKGEVLEYKDNEIKCNVVEYEFTREDAYNVAKAVLTKLKEDDKLLEIVFGKIDNLYSLYEEAGYDMTGEIPDIEEVKEEIENELEDLENAYDEEDADEVGLIIRNYYTNNLAVLKRELISLDEEKFEIYSINNKEDAYYALEADETAFAVEIAKGKDEDKYNISITNPSNEKIEIPVTVEKKSDNEKLVKGEIKIPDNNDATFTFECIVIEEKEKTDIDLDIKLTDNKQKIDMILSIEGATEQDATIEKLDVSNAWDIAKASQSEINTEVSKIQSNLMSLYYKIAMKLY